MSWSILIKPSLAHFEKKSQVKFGRFDKKVKNMPHKVYFLNQTYSDSDRSCDVISSEILKNFNTLSGSAVVRQNVRERARNCSYEKCSYLETIEDFWFKISYGSSKHVKTSKLFPQNCLRNNLSKSIIAGLDRSGSDRIKLRYGLDIVINTPFLHKPYRKKN